MDLKNSIEYQSNAVVSKEILKTPAGTITLFAFDEGQGLSEHSTPFEALVQVMEGEVEIIISGKKHMVTEGEIIHLPANNSHSLKSNKKFKMLLTMLKE